MKILDLIEEDFVNYKKPSLLIAFPFCTFKCEKECGVQCCQNSRLAKQNIISIPTDNIVQRFLGNPISESIVAGGLEPMDSFGELVSLIHKFRESTDAEFIIYTGYNKEEVEDKLETLRQYKNIIVKFGRFVPDKPHHRDDVLGVELASPNQYAERIS